MGRRGEAVSASSDEAMVELTYGILGLQKKAAQRFAKDWNLEHGIQFAIQTGSSYSQKLSLSLE